MTSLTPSAWTRPDAATTSAPAPGAAGSSPPAYPLGRLPGSGENPVRDSHRIALGLAALGAIAVVLLNVGVYHWASEHQERQGQARIAAAIEEKRADVAAIVRQLESEARYVATEPALGRWAQRAQTGTADAADRDAALDALTHAQTAFGFRAAHLILPDGSIPLSTAETTEPEALRPFLPAGEPTDGAPIDEVVRESDGSVSLGIAAPLHATGAKIAPLVVFEMDVDRAFLPLLTSWPGFGAGAGAYLVQQHGDRVVALSTPPVATGIRGGEPLLPEAPRARLAAMAAAGVESSVPGVDQHGHAVLAATRFLPDLRIGVVGQVDRAAMMQATRGTLAGLLTLDLAMVALALAGIWLSRRQYATGLAEREVEVTRRHAERVHAVFDAAFDAIVTFDGRGRVHTVNRAAESLFGRPATELVDEPMSRFMHWGPAGKPSQELPAPGTVCRAEVLRADGATVPVEFSLGVSGHGEDLLYSAIVRDTSERVEAERRIKAFADGLEASNRRLEELNAQLEEASRLKSEFLANTSHELRTPLNGILGFLQLVLDGMCDSRDEEKDFLRQALQCSRHLLGLINDVLDIAKIEAGKLNLEIEAVDVNRLFDEVHTVTHVQAAQKGIALRFLPPEGAAIHARGDFGKIKQIVINLVGNSLKFTTRGSVTVSAIPHPELGHIMFEVTDTGIGIPAERQKVIFEKFTQGDGSTTRRFGGTGLGLAISKSLVELMGGIIGCQSDGEGKGTKMYFSLPVWGEESAPAESEGDASDRISGPAGGALVMVVEDDPVFRNFLAALLHAHGYRTIAAPNAETGWLLARRLRPAVVVLDYALTSAESAMMRTGWDLAERMTTDNATRHIPIIFVTGFEGELRERLKATAFARRPEHLMKPVQGDVLAAKIEELVGSRMDRVVRVLMADDDPSVGAYIRKVLPEDRYHIEVASNGEECLHVLRTQPRGFDLLLLDLMMPEVSGYEVLKEMTLAKINTELPVLVLTNFPEPRNDEEKRLLETGLVLDVLPKTSVHENPLLLAHIIDWHLQVVREDGVEDEAPGDEPRKAA